MAVAVQRVVLGVGVEAARDAIPVILTRIPLEPIVSPVPRFKPAGRRCRRSAVQKVFDALLLTSATSKVRHTPNPIRLEKASEIPPR